MLIYESEALEMDYIAKIIAEANGNNTISRELQTGVYLRGDFGSSEFLKSYDCSPSIDNIYCYGVCDSVENLLQKCPELESSERKFVVTLTKVSKSEQPEEGGWRWHKWG